MKYQILSKTHMKKLRRCKNNINIRTIITRKEQQRREENEEQLHLQLIMISEAVILLSLLCRWINVHYTYNFTWIIYFYIWLKFLIFWSENFFRRAVQKCCGYWIRLTHNARLGKVGSSHCYLDRRQLHEIATFDEIVTTKNILNNWLHYQE